MRRIAMALLLAWTAALCACEELGDDDGSGPPDDAPSCYLVIGGHDSCSTECTTEDGIETCSQVCHWINECGDCGAIAKDHMCAEQHCSDFCPAGA